MGQLDAIGALGPTSALVSADASTLLHGAIRLVREADGWVRPWRFSEEQMRALGSCQAWHPGLFRQMARTTAGVCIEFDTDSSEVAVEVSLDEEPPATRSVLGWVDDLAPDDAPSAHDGLSCVSDGHRLGVAMPALGEKSVLFSLDSLDEVPAGAPMRLPGMGDTHRVRIWLPCLRGCRVRRVVGNGTTIAPVADRPHLLVLGDSIAQGFVCGDPALAWPALLADELGLDLLNQGLGGQVFQPGSLFGLARSIEPARIVVEYGENYRYEPCRARLVTRDVRSYLLEVARLWPGVDTTVVTPLWHDEYSHPSHPLSCFSSVPSFLAAHVAPHDQMRLADGRRLLDHKASLMADGYEHPNAKGSRQIAERLLCVMRTGGDQASLRERALAELSGAPRRALPLAEMLRRGAGQVIYAHDGCVLAQTTEGMQVLWARDRAAGRRVVEALVDAPLVDCLEPALVRDVTHRCGLTQVEPYHVCVFEKRRAPKQDASRDIRPLDEKSFYALRTLYSHPEFKTDAEILDLLRSGRCLGGFENGELVGFVGEHPSGSIGMLEVFPAWRRQGWGLALESAKIRETLDRGEVPWCEVFAGNEASLALQERLGLTVVASNETCYLSVPPAPAAPLDDLDSIDEPA